MRKRTFYLLLASIFVFVFIISCEEKDDPINPNIAICEELELAMTEAANLYSGNFSTENCSNYTTAIENYINECSLLVQSQKDSLDLIIESLGCDSMICEEYKLKMDEAFDVYTSNPTSINCSNYNLSISNYINNCHNLTQAQIINYQSIIDKLHCDPIVITWTSATVNDSIINFTNNVSNWILSLAVDQSNNVWVGTYCGLSVFDGTNWTSYTADDGLISNAIKALEIDRNGNIWVGTEYGLSKFDGTTWTNYTENDGLVYDNIMSLSSDSENNLWIGTRSSNRYYKFDGTNFEYGSISGNDDMGHIHAICCDLDSNVWFGSCMSGLSKLDLKTGNWSHHINNLNVFVESIYCTPEGDIWVGSSGAYQYSNESWSDYTYENGSLPDYYVHSITSDIKGNVWVGTGPSFFDGNIWKTYSYSDCGITEEPNALASDSEGNIWIGTKNGLSKISLTIE